MPRKPDFTRHQPDARFDAYRDRVGRLFRGDDEVGLALVQVEPYAMSSGGHLWWRRWEASRDHLWIWTVVDGQFSDSLLPDDASGDELADYAAGRFRHYGESLRIDWLDADESRRLRLSEFGV